MDNKMKDIKIREGVVRRAPRKPGDKTQWEAVLEAAKKSTTESAMMSTSKAIWDEANEEFGAVSTVRRFNSVRRKA